MSGGESKRTISAMVRVRNEAEFLEASVRSVVDHVDEIVIIDNRSDDESPAIIDRLAAEFPGKVVPHFYPHEIRRVGLETWRLAENPETAESPHLSSAYYNWCLGKCTMKYAMKWDGDMIALPRFATALDEWRATGREVLVFHGVNVHPNRKNLIRARIEDREKILPDLSVPGLPKWATSLTYDYPEPRLHPLAGARYTNRILWTQELFVPAYNGDKEARSVHRVEGPCHLHMKFCKSDPMANYTPDLAKAIWSNIDLGPPLEEEWLRILEAGAGPCGS